MVNEYCERCGEIKEQCQCGSASDGVLGAVMPKKKPYSRTAYLVRNYKDLKNGEELEGDERAARLMIDRAVELISDDKYINVLRMTMEGARAEEIAETEKIDISNVYRQRKRLIKRLSVVIYGDSAL